MEILNMKTIGCTIINIIQVVQLLIIYFINISL